MDGCLSAGQGDCRRYYLGVIIDQPPGAEINGKAVDIPSDVGAAYLSEFLSLPHELAHMANSLHTLCEGSEAGSDPNYPYPGGKISQEIDGDNAFFGINYLDSKVYGPSSADLMSYCPARWPSRYTFDNIRNFFTIHYENTSTLDNQPLYIEAITPVVLVAGNVDTGLENGQINTVYQYSSSLSASSPTPGSYTLNFEDASQQLIHTFTFQPNIYEQEGTRGSFVLVLPWDPAAKRIVLLHDGIILDTRQASSSAPVVTVTYPNGGETLNSPSDTITWSASDGDSDSLTYVVQYSPDNGVTWQTLATEIFEKSIEVNVDYLKGTQQALVKVFASDGFLTSFDQSDAVFTTNKHHPAPVIDSPAGSAMYIGGQLVILRGSAQDTEDGRLNGASLTWKSDLDGVLGNGETLEVNAAGLVEGVHTITLEAVDSDEMTGQKAVQITIYRARPFIPTELSLSANVVSFSAIAGITQTRPERIAIRNAGDGSMNWSATVDQAWIHMNLSGGTAPSDLSIYIDPTSLPVGQSIGHVTITADGADQSPQEITIFIQKQKTLSTFIPVIFH
jgi:hypothetical protein